MSITPLMYCVDVFIKFFKLIHSVKCNINHDLIHSYNCKAIIIWIVIILIYHKTWCSILGKYTWWNITRTYFFLYYVGTLFADFFNRCLWSYTYSGGSSSVGKPTTTTNPLMKRHAPVTPNISAIHQALFNRSQPPTSGQVFLVKLPKPQAKKDTL